MNYGVAAIRFDMGKEARIRTAQYFGISSVLAPSEIAWVLTVPPIRPS